MRENESLMRMESEGIDRFRIEFIKSQLSYCVYCGNIIPIIVNQEGCSMEHNRDV